MSTHILRVVWPIHDDAMYDDEAIADAWIDWPHHPEKQQVTVVDTPRMHVVRLDPRQQEAFGASRAVMCEAHVIERTPIPIKKEAA
ncbi:hypothetical protein [Actinoplanes rectilineatus]|uniref:hypothetical protein n=1 Tax=Actinoplanes rectilineatus TaxID=113571 RepID=UPI0005F29131|nr:hypothetical protein [Actinoplanes rectilineatus]